MDEHDRDEQQWMLGNKAAWTAMLSQCLQRLAAERNAHAWQLEREAAIARLRELCLEHGDNDWPDDCPLDEVIENHLGKHLMS